MTYNVFGGTLNLAQSINPYQCHLLDVAQKLSRRIKKLQETELSLDDMDSADTNFVLEERCVFSVLMLLTLTINRNRSNSVIGCIVLLNIQTVSLPTPKIAPSPGGSGLPSNTWLCGPTRAHMPNCISISSAVFGGFIPVCLLYTSDAADE